MKLEDIGFYTLSDNRAKTATSTSDLSRCELIVTNRCNFRCPYCRGLRDDINRELTKEEAIAVLDLWIDDNLHAVRFSGGEPTVWPYLVDVVEYAKLGGIEHIAISTNGSAPQMLYQRLLDAGANDFSVSFDACCSEDVDKMAGRTGHFDTIVSNIKFLSTHTYVTVGIVVNDDNVDTLIDTVALAHSLGVADIRVISAAQHNKLLGVGTDLEHFDDAHPILKYRAANMRNGRNVRGLTPTDTGHCGLVVDDMIVASGYHFPCVIYMREGGDPIGRVGENMRTERAVWSATHNTHCDPICKQNCLDVCIDYNNRFARQS